MVLPKENPALPQGQESSDNEGRDAEPSKVIPIVKDPPRTFVPISPYPKRLQLSRNKGSLWAF